MGKETEKTGGSHPKAVPAGEHGGSAKSESASNPTKTGSGGRGSAGTGGEPEKEKLLGLADVAKTPEEIKKEERNAKRRARYAAKKAAAPKKLQAGGSKKDADPAQCEAVIMAVSHVVSSREGCAHWQLTPDECKSLAQPIANMLRDSKALAGINEHADAAALTMAAFTIFAPRIMITQGIRKEKKKNAGKINGSNGRDARGIEKGQNISSNRDNAGDHASHGDDADKTQSILGAALC